ncbi:hypothetical protein HZH66_007029 [Vespula vulgaris]|uniref:Uncharacterized protein n=1 Tax=Vespula vulgaris TaxID=7454 RepID=A0A834N4P4_VESVU|nr:hypothetical protein HZH66_007029 [Vespula vulgaris]
MDAGVVVVVLEEFQRKSNGISDFVWRMYIATIHAHRSERHIARGALRKGMVMSSAPTVSTFYHVTWAEPTTCMYPPCPCLRKVPFSKFFDLSLLRRIVKNNDVVFDGRD